MDPEELDPEETVREPPARAAPEISPASPPSPAAQPNDEFRALPRQALQAALLGNGVSLGVLLIGALGSSVGVAFATAAPRRGWLLLAIWLLYLSLATWTLVMTVLSHRLLRYRADPRGLQIKRGVIWRSWAHVPRSRIQHTDVTRGPIDRVFGVSALVVHTAGTHQASTRLDGLLHREAIEVRDRLSADRGNADGV